MLQTLATRNNTYPRSVVETATTTNTLTQYLLAIDLGGEMDASILALFSYLNSTAQRCLNRTGVAIMLSVQTIGYQKEGSELEMNFCWKQEEVDQLEFQRSGQAHELKRPVSSNKNQDRGYPGLSNV